MCELIGVIPSPRGTTWYWYIEHRLKVMENGINTYTTRTYARLNLDKYIEWHRAIDLIAGRLVNHKPAIIYFGCGRIPPNSPISIQKHVRCPGNRKLIGAFKKRNNCVVKMVNENFTSQTCGRCFKRFDPHTKRFRFKTCTNCEPQQSVMLPPVIVTNVSKRALQMRRTIMKTWQEMSEMGNMIATNLTQADTRRLVSKKERFYKTWQPNANVDVGVNNADHPKLLKTVWHRDISAAKLILYRGK